MLLAPPTHRPPHTARRSGTATLWMLGILAIGTVMTASVLEIYRLQAARVEMQNAADAAATAAARRLIDDTMLVGDAATDAAQFTSARTHARMFALFNGVLGDPVVIENGQPNDYGSEVAIGRVDPNRSNKVFYIGDLSAFEQPPPVNLLLNAVRVHADLARSREGSFGWRFLRTVGLPSANVAAETTAILDRDVIGFGPEGSLPIPLAPIALLSDPNATNPVSWEYLVEQKNGPDDFRYDRARGKLLPDTDPVQSDPDGLHEMAVTFDPSSGTVNACVLQIGVQNWSDMTTQVQSGVSSAQVLSLPGGRLLQSASVPVFAFPASGSSDANALYSSLAQLEATGEARAWPLAQTIPSSGNVVVTGFVAARVARPLSGGSNLIIQPCMMAVPSAVTDASQRPANRPAGNPYICKIRIVQ